jgi:hypothetical protein
MRKTFLIPVLILFFSSIAFTQPVDDDLPQITGCVALINAKVVAAPGKAPVTSTIVMRDGMITHIGPNIKIPADAYRIAADSFYVYPAFIDAFSYTGIKEAEKDGDANERGPGNRGPRKSVDEEGTLGTREVNRTVLGALGGSDYRSSGGN